VELFWQGCQISSLNLCLYFHSAYYKYNYSHLNRPLQAGVLQFPFYSINSSQIKRLQTIQNALARAVTKTPKHQHIHVTPVLKSLHWLKIPQRIHYKIAFLTILFKPPNPLTFANFSPSKHPGLLAHHHIFRCLALQSHPLWSSATAPLPTLHQLFGMDSQKTSVSLHILLTHLLISPILRSHSPLLHSTHDW